MNIFNNRRSASFSLFAINIAVFFILYMIPHLFPYLAVYPYGLLREYKFWTPFTYMFVHMDFTHLLFNMVFLIFVAPSVEARMGKYEFIAYYLITGTLAGLFSIMAYMSSGVNVPIIGASGALYAVLLAFATYYPRAQILVFYVLPMRAPYAMALFAGLDLFMHMRGGLGIAHLTHLSGLAFGYLYFVIRLRVNPIKVMRNEI